MITTIYTCSPKRDYLSLSHICLQSTRSLLVPGYIFEASHRLSYAVSSAPKPHDTCTPIPYGINSFSSLSPSAIVRILKHSQSQYTEGDSFCKYYSIAFAIHTRLAGGLALELGCLGQRLLKLPSRKRGWGVCCGELTHPFIPSF